jgi:hypothetical protein
VAKVTRGVVVSPLFIEGDRWRVGVPWVCLGESMLAWRAGWRGHAAQLGCGFGLLHRKRSG